MNKLSLFPIILITIVHNRKKKIGDFFFNLKETLVIMHKPLQLQQEQVTAHRQRNRDGVQRRRESHAGMCSAERLHVFFK